MPETKTERLLVINQISASLCILMSLMTSHRKWLRITQWMRGWGKPG